MDLSVGFLKMGKPSSVPKYSKDSLVRQPQIFDGGTVIGAQLESFHREGLREADGRTPRGLNRKLAELAAHFS